MTTEVTAVHPAGAYQALRRAVDDAKGASPLTPVSVIVPTNATGVAARRWLGRNGGVAAVDMLTPQRVAEVIGGPALALEQRQPLSVPVIDISIEKALAELDTPFRQVADHPSTVVALRELYREVRLAGAASLTALSGLSLSARSAADIISAVQATLRGRWYDEADLLGAASRAVLNNGAPPQLQRTIVFLPHPPHGLELELFASLAERAELRLLLPHTGNEQIDGEYQPACTRLGVSPPEPPAIPGGELPAPVRSLCSTSDADTEVRAAVERLVDAARSGVAFSRMALLWPVNEPYARLVEHHLNAADIPWNGRPGTGPIERVVPRFLLDLLSVDRLGLRRDSLFELLADVPGRDASGRPIPVAHWERVSRAAGIAGPEHWRPRLSGFITRQRERADAGSDSAARDADHAEALLTYVTHLTTDLGRPGATRLWAEWAEWAESQIEQRLGGEFLGSLNEAEHLAREHAARVLERLATLDHVGDPPTRARFAAAFQAEFDVAPGRLGRLGTGVTVGAITGQVGLDADVVVVVGAADGQMPPPPRSGPLLSPTDRQHARLLPADSIGNRMHRGVLSLLSGRSEVHVTRPRGDLRGTATRYLSRWFDDFATTAACVDLPSHYAAVRQSPFPVNPAEHQLHRYATAAPAGQLGQHHPDDIDDVRLRHSLTMRAARRSSSVTEFDGDLSSLSIPLPDRPISATQIEQYRACPHGYFMKYLLGVRDLDDPAIELQMSPLDKGNAIHEVLDRLHREVISGELPQPTGGWTERHIERACELFVMVTDRLDSVGRTGRPVSWAVERLKMCAELIEWMGRDSSLLAAIGAQIVGSEHRFGRDQPVVIEVDGGRHLKVFGAVDRILQGSNGQLFVIDYKTGGNYVSELSTENPTLDGTKFQPSIYAEAAIAAFGSPTSVEAGYSHFQKGNYELVTMRYTDDVRADVSRRIGVILDAIEAGFFPALPSEPRGFEPFIECVYCQPDRLNRDQRWNELQAKIGDHRFTEYALVAADTAEVAS